MKLFYIHAGYHSFYYIIEAENEEQAKVMADKEYSSGYAEGFNTGLEADFTDYHCTEITITGKPGILV